MDPTNQLALLDFENHNIQVYGSQQDPLIKCSDLLIHVLQYKDCSKANWFKELKNDTYYVTPVNQGGDRYFTEQGIYKALMKSNKPIAEEFQKRVCNLLKSMRQQQQQQLEQQQLQIQQQEQLIEQYESMKKRGVIYEIYYTQDQHENYIGMHEGIDPEERFKTHINGALQSLKQPLYRRIFREGLKYFKIRKIKDVDYYHCDELLETESTLIDELNPSLNRNYYFECECGRELKQEHAIFEHRQQCEQYTPLI